jgi:hypothetical protein
MNDWVPFSLRSEWADVIPVKEFSNDISVGKIAYTQQCKL